MKRSLLFSLPLIGLLFLLACTGSLESKLIGTWKVVDVQTEFNESDVTPETLRQVVEREKKNAFRILDDSTLVIMISGSTYEARWIIDKSTGKINYFFSGMETESNVLGTYEDGRVIQESKTPVGKMTTVYEKE